MVGSQGDDWEFNEELANEAGVPSRDPKTDEAKREVSQLLASNRQSVFYVKQLQVKFESRFYHWITARAVKELVLEGSVGAEDVPLKVGGRARFIFARGHRYRSRQVERAVAIINRYSEPLMARACGDHAEQLFLTALAEYGFLCTGRNTREVWAIDNEGQRELRKAWTASGHTLDFIVERDGVSYGAEVKNTWDYIERDELETKLTMCGSLELRPLFIMRHSPKTYNYLVEQGGGYAMIFVAHIYPYLAGELVREIRETFGMPCDSPRRIPDSILQRFDRWHRKRRLRESGGEFTVGGR